MLPLDVLSRIVASLYSIEGLFRMQPEGAVPPNPPRSALRPVSPAASHPFMWPRAATGSAGTPLRDCMDNNPSWEEFTIEVNPEDIVEKGEDYVRGLMELGMNRVSMGIQSFDDGILRWMNRRHNASGAEEAFRILRHCGVDNISVDLIFGLSQLDDETWTATIEKTLSLRPEHISCRWKMTAHWRNSSKKGSTWKLPMINAAGSMTSFARNSGRQDTIITKFPILPFPGWRRHITAPTGEGSHMSDWAPEHIPCRLMESVHGTVAPCPDIHGKKKSSRRKTSASRG